MLLLRSFRDNGDMAQKKIIIAATVIIYTICISMYRLWNISYVSLTTFDYLQCVMRHRHLIVLSILFVDERELTRIANVFFEKKLHPK